MPNVGYCIQQMTRRNAGTLFDEGTDKNRAVILIVKLPLALESGQLDDYTYVQYILCRSHVRSPRQELPCLGRNRASKSAIAGRSTP